MSDYYPEFYLRKRQREQAYRRATVITVGFLTLLAAGGIIGYLILNAVGTRRTEPGATPELAQQQQELKTQQQLASAEVPAAMETTADEPTIDLSTVSYSESFPKVNVSVSDAESPAGDSTDPAAPTAEDADSADREAEADSLAENTSETAAQPSPQDERIGSVTPSDDEAQRRAEQQKRQEQARREAEKREAAKRADDKRKREEEKRREAEAEKSAEQQEESKEVRAPARPGGYSYTVYGGTYLTEQDAEKKKAELGALGLSGIVIKAGGDHLLLVGKFDDEDSAKALRNKLSGSGFGGAFVTRKAK